MIDYLSEKLKFSFNKLRKNRKPTRTEIEDILSEIKFIFLESDINYDVTIDFIENIKSQLEDLWIKKKETTSNVILSIISKEMIKILGEKVYEINIKNKPTFILLVGLQGAGKTTTIGKLAYHYKNKLKKKVLIVGCDNRRPAAYEQLKKYVKNQEIETFFIVNKIPLEIAKDGIAKSYEENYDIVLFDSAGRNSIDEELMTEIKDLVDFIKPSETIFIVDSLIGQNVINVVEKFENRIKINSVILTKFDSEARSGSVFSIAYNKKLPIAFVGTGEEINKLDEFYPDRVVSRIMGKGDIKTLIEKTSQHFSYKNSIGYIQKFLSGDFGLDDLIKQIKRFEKIGSLKSIFKLIPGSMKLSDEKHEKIKHKINVLKLISSSATPEERKNIKLLLINTRKIRIIKGSGISSNDYNILIKQIKKFKTEIKGIKNLIKI